MGVLSELLLVDDLKVQEAPLCGARHDKAPGFPREPLPEGSEKQDPGPPPKCDELLLIVCIDFHAH